MAPALHIQKPSSLRAHSLSVSKARLLGLRLVLLEKVQALA